MLKLANYALNGVPYTDPPTLSTDGKIPLVLALQGSGAGQRIGRTISVVSLDVVWSIDHTTVAAGAEDTNTVRVIFAEDRAPLGSDIRDYSAAFDINPGFAQLSHVKTDVLPPLFTVLADDLHVIRSQNATKTRLSGRKHLDFSSQPLVFMFPYDPLQDFPVNRQIGAYFILQKIDPLGIDAFNLNVQMAYYDH